MGRVNGSFRAIGKRKCFAFLGEVMRCDGVSHLQRDASSFWLILRDGCCQHKPTLSETAEFFSSSFPITKIACFSFLRPRLFTKFN